LRPKFHTVSAGIPLIEADSLNSLGFNGSDVKIAVLDLGFQGCTRVFGTELPSDLITRSFHSQGIEAWEEHGVACAEIVYIIAPAAQLCLVNFETSLDVTDAVDWFITQEVDIISFSTGFYNAGPGDGTGSICEIVDEAESNGIMFVVSGGNEAESHYETTFSDPDSDGYHNVDGDSEVIPITVYSGEILKLYLSGGASWPTIQDYDLLLFDSDLNLVAASYNVLVSSYYPIELPSFTAHSTDVYQIIVSDYSTNSPHKLELFSTYFLEDFDFLLFPGFYRFCHLFLSQAASTSVQILNHQHPNHSKTPPKPTRGAIDHLFQPSITRPPGEES